MTAPEVGSRLAEVLFVAGESWAAPGVNTLFCLWDFSKVCYTIAHREDYVVINHPEKPN